MQLYFEHLKHFSFPFFKIITTPLSGINCAVFNRQIVFTLSTNSYRYVTFELTASGTKINSEVPELPTLLHSPYGCFSV